jgi:hypothetical protein
MLSKRGMFDANKVIKRRQAPLAGHLFWNLGQVQTIIQAL